VGVGVTGWTKVDVIISSTDKRSLPVVALDRRPVATLQSRVRDIINSVVVVVS
jgi:hypothetical protein